MRFLKHPFLMLLVFSSLALPFSSIFAQQPTVVIVTGQTGSPNPNPGGSPNHCSDLKKDADETGVDCGGKDCKPCLTNSTSGQQRPELKPQKRVTFACDPGSQALPPTGGGTTTSYPPPSPSCQNNPDGTITETYTQSNGVTPSTGPTTSDDGTKKSYNPASSCAWDGSISTPQCDMNNVKWNSSYCPSGAVCYNGGCVSGTGTCGMGGGDQNVTLTVTTSDGHTETFRGWNYCGYDKDGSQYVEKAFCYGGQNHLSYEKSYCTKGTICIHGECKPPLEPTCKENGDGTISVTTATGYSFTTGTMDNYCGDDKTLEVPYCDGNLQNYKSQLCPNGHECKNGACRRKLPPCSPSWIKIR